MASTLTQSHTHPPRSAFKRLIEETGAVDQVGIEERVAKFATRSIKKKSKVWGLTTAVSMVDLTTLEGKDTPGKVRSLCQKARRPSEDPEVPPVAAVCIYPFLVKYARKWLADTPIKVASVATSFPSGQSPLKLRLAEVRQAVSDGADEVDMVINRGLFLAGEFDAVQDEIAAVVEACGDATLKVILEVSELESYDNIRAALRWSVAVGGECAGGVEVVGIGLQLVAALWRFWDMRGYLKEGRFWLEQLLTIHARRLPAETAQWSATHPWMRERAQALIGAGLFAWRQGDLAEAQRALLQSLAIGRFLDSSRLDRSSRHERSRRVMLASMP